MKKISCGIDFGTSNSAVSIASDKVHLIPVEGEKITIPSALFFDEEEKNILFGKHAQIAYTDGYDGRFMRSLKRVLGTSLMNQGTVVNGKLTSFSDIISSFIRHLKHKITESGHEIENVVMGRPVHFVDYDLSADNRAQNELEEIAKKIGFKNIKFQYEPIAAAFAHEQNITTEKLALVVDIGGGTSDFTVIKLGKNLKNKTDRSDDILANTGIRIGGNDFDKSLSLNAIMPDLGYETNFGNKNLTVPKMQFHDLSEWSKINFVYTPQVVRRFADMLKKSHSPEKLSRFVNTIKNQQGHHLLQSTEAAKIDLTGNSDTIIKLNYVEDDFNIGISQRLFNESINENVEKITRDVKNCLNQAQIKPDDITLVILTGGSTEIPYIQSVLSAIFPNAKLSQDNKLSSVALGLGYDAKNQF